MSPTEHDLRAALSDGEGDGLDADRLIATGRAQQARRRTQLLTTAAVIVVLAGAGTGITALVRGGGGNTNADSAAVGAYAARGGPSGSGDAGGGASGAAGSSSRPAPLNGAKAAETSAGCPASLPRYALPGGGSPGQFGADGPLFSRPVRTVIVCAYDANARASASAPTAAQAPRRATLGGAQATRLAASLNAAASAPGASCPKHGLVAPTRAFAIIGIAADGNAVGTVTATYPPTGCAAQVTNGTAVRYNWTPPGDLAAILVKLTR